MRTGRTLKYIAFALGALWGVLFGLFAAGYALEVPGGAGLVALYAVPMILLSGLAVWRPDWAWPVLAVLVVVVIGVGVADTFRIGIDRNVSGPVGAISQLAVGFALAFLGLRRAKTAGLLLVVLALASFGVLLAGYVRMVGPASEGPGIWALLGGSAGVGILPTLLVGALFLLAGYLMKEPLLGGRTPSPADPTTQKPASG